MNRICVIGLGYIGLPTAAMFANQGLDVIGVDIKQSIIDTLNEGRIHIQEDGLAEIVQKAIRAGKLSFSPAPVPADAFIIAVPTPFNHDKTADMRMVISATESILPVLQPGNLVILESTSPPLTTENLVRPILERSGLKAGKDFRLAYSPERVLPGQILRELIENARVIGGIDSLSAQAGCKLYSTFVKGEILLTDSTTAEMVKLMENTYRDVNIALANEFSRLADRFGIDIWEATAIANHHPRVKILTPGPGVGGHCISVDPWFLVEAAPDLAQLIRTARQVNDGQPHFVLELVRRALGDLEGQTIAVLGLAFKAGVDDLRESPAVEIANLIAAEGAKVIAYEPYRADEKFNGFDTVNSLEAAVKNADSILLLVRHQQFVGLEPDVVRKLTPANILIDTVNAWEPAPWSQAGFSIFRLGDNRPRLELERTER